MGFVAVMKGNDAEYTVDHLDLQLWCLAGLLPIFQRVFLDVGVVVTVDESSADKLTHINIALPFRVESDSIENLRPAVTADMAHLLVGRPEVGTGADPHVTFQGLQGVPSIDGNTKIRFIDPNMADITREAIDGSQNGFLYRVKLGQELKAGETGYIRLRFHVEQTYRAVVWKKSAFPPVWAAMNGAVFDIAVDDLQEMGAEARRRWAEQLSPAQALDVRMMIRASWQPREAIPQYARSRLLEKGVWEHYIRRPIDLRNEGFIVVYEWEWRPEAGGGEAEADQSQAQPSAAAPPQTAAVVNVPRSAGQVDGRGPVSIFLSVGREFGLLAWANLPRLVLMVIIANALVDGLPHWTHTGIVEIPRGTAEGIADAGAAVARFAVELRRNPREVWDSINVLATLAGIGAIGAVVAVIRFARGLPHRFRVRERKWFHSQLKRRLEKAASRIA